MVRHQRSGLLESGLAANFHDAFRHHISGFHFGTSSTHTLPIRLEPGRFSVRIGTGDLPLSVLH